MLKTALIYKDVFARLKNRDYKDMPRKEDWIITKLAEKLQLL